MSEFDTWMQKLSKMKDFDPEKEMPQNLVTEPESAYWLGEKETGNPSKVGVLIDIPAHSMEFYLQEIPAGASSDLQRHLHESVHCITEGSGYSEIGDRVLTWKAGDFIYTPPWVWHRHYNDGQTVVRMILVENSKLLDSLSINQRESAGNISYQEFRGLSD